MSMQSPTQTQTATLGGGCFWCLEAVYNRLNGVLSVQSGYSGGALRNPSYRAVCEGDSGHAEVVQITFDPAQVGYLELLEVFFVIHDPTTLNRQGNDEGTQYRSVIFFHSAEQEDIAHHCVRDLVRQGIFDDPVVTEIVPAAPFYPAEDVHDRYFERNGEQPYCRLVVAPKVAKFRSKFQSKLRDIS
jgi:peptide-methionine (S)-S-oxide reductase